MAIDYTNIDEVVNDFQLMIDDTSYDNEAQIYQLRLLALQGLRELTFDAEQVVKRVERDVSTNSLLITLPDDFVKLLRVGYKGDDDMFHSLGYSSDLSLSKSVSAQVGDSLYDENNPYYHTDIGKKFGIGGGKNSLGYYRVNRQDGTINFSSDVGGKKVFFEYISDGTSRSSEDHRLKLKFNEASDIVGSDAGEGVTSSILYIPDPRLPLSGGANTRKEITFKTGSVSTDAAENVVIIAAGDNAGQVAKKFTSFINDGYPSQNIAPFSTILTASRLANEVILSYRSTRPDLLNHSSYALNSTGSTTSGKPLETSIEVLQIGGEESKPRVHKFCEEALRCYIYYKYIQRKRGIPANEKQMAKRAYYNEKRLARARMMNFNKETAMQVSRKAFKQSPKI